MLASLADESWSQLDVSGCSRICGAELLAAAPSMPHITALDVTGVSWWMLLASKQLDVTGLSWWLLLASGQCHSAGTACNAHCRLDCCQLAQV
jgi:hypothetical protein